MKILRYGAVIFFLMSLWGCSKGNDAVPAAAAIDPATNKHPAGMAVAVTGGAHVDAYYLNPSYCEGCHGKPADLKGGTSKVSCSMVSKSGISCHAGKWPHGAGYAAYNQHGNTARSEAAGVSGMAYCKKCHGSDYTGVPGIGVSCISCHTAADGSHAPHAANWLTGANINGLRHSRTVASNAAACAQCHLGGAFSHAPPTPAAKGTAPGCFNGTLCHNQAGHNPYTIVSHQVDARDNVVCGLACHATPASGTSNPLFTVPFTTTSPPSDIISMTAGCQSAGCHNQKPGLAHPYIWLPNRGSGNTTHGNNGTTGIPGNVLNACGTCHNVTAVGAKFGVPSCMSGAAGVPGLIPTIICHFTSPVTGTNVTAGCNSCHGGLPSGPDGVSTPNTASAHPKHTVISGVTCTTCHNGAGDGTQLHANGVTNVALLASQAGVGAAYTGVITKTCANVVCHGLTTTPAWTATNQGCTTCHVSPPNTNNHTSHWTVFPTPAVKCDACHTGDGPGLGITHPNGIPVVGFPANFSDAGSPVAAYAGGVCSNVSCHGGNPIPAWTTAASPAFLANCANCHTLVATDGNPAGATYHYINVYNGDNAGAVGGDPLTGATGSTGANNLHDGHVTVLGYVCTDCHGGTLSSVHFSQINNGSRQFNNDPQGRAFAAPTLTGPGIVVYIGGPKGTCSNACHEDRNWFK